MNDLNHRERVDSMFDETNNIQQTEETPSAKQIKFALEEKWNQEQSAEKGEDNMAQQEHPMTENPAQEQQEREQPPQTDAVARDDEKNDYDNNDDKNVEMIEKLLLERNEYLDHMKRLQAEFDNFRKRTLREKEELRAYLLQEFISQLLPVVDTFQRALDSASGATDIESYRQGVEMVHQQFMNILVENGLEKIDAVGQPFDPNLHEAVSQIESADHPAGTVVTEFSPGYKLKERVIQAPKVQVTVAVQDTSEHDPAADPSLQDQKASGTES